ncbi:hypothetical protein [Rubinisphaera brasiliensis]|uniref:Solute carrier family 8 (Sodium-calcium exchanger), member 3 n=1 Tax=Rubinisphaera brasiliensis (strain ATCC 49424 / DSM 5305 / JCM 21570 / IAM 15109 / NBRC 103401 / IFAM 1448) TaxID=756272 RepID=F0SNV2_RUBBR|nr:hypothetical protein [Rubinisphaera brasiliensis]ADY60028.1 solute carrier family 8 (sodium-calcium exchanger), member 3 [Rubinisphaera brasiliensis DSM 5305]
MEEDTQPGLYMPILMGTLAILLTYFLVFALICVDELVLKTFYISNYIPLGPDGEEIVRKIYFPLLWLLSLL